MKTQAGKKAYVQVKQHRVSQVFLINECGYRAGRFAGIDTQEDKSMLLMGLIIGIQVRYLRPAGRTPGSPGIEQHHFTGIIAQACRLAMDVGQAEISQSLPHLCRVDSLRGRFTRK